jgi:hypothetical protein
MSSGFRHPFLAVLVASVLVVAMAAPADAMPTAGVAVAVNASAPVVVPGIAAKAVSLPKSSDFGTRGPGPNQHVRMRGW